MSLEEYEDFVFGATFADKADPVAGGRSSARCSRRRFDWAEGQEERPASGAEHSTWNCRLMDGVFINACGERNMPDGEIFTGPVEDVGQRLVPRQLPLDCAGAGGSKVSS